MIASDGVAAETSLTPTLKPHAFVYLEDTMFDLNDHVVLQVGVVFRKSVSINDRGDILACGCDPMGQGADRYRSFILSPEPGPLPASLSRAVAGGLLVAFQTRRRRK